MEANEFYTVNFTIRGHINVRGDSSPYSAYNLARVRLESLECVDTVPEQAGEVLEFDPAYVDLHEIYNSNGEQEDPDDELVEDDEKDSDEEGEEEQFFHYEYDESWFGGIYTSIGDSAYISIHLILSHGWYGAFEKATGIDRIHIVHYDMNEYYTRERLKELGLEKQIYEFVEK